MNEDQHKFVSNEAQKPSTSQVEVLFFETLQNDDGVLK